MKDDRSTPRVLLGAFYWSPYRGGEAAVGWNFSTRLAKGHEVTVLTGDLDGKKRWLEELERARVEGIVPEGLRVVGVEPPPWARFLHRLHRLPGCWFLYYQAYRLWQKEALRVGKRLHRERPFDLVHQLTIITWREPGYLWKLGIPFFWGPINGAAILPWSFLPTFGAGGFYRHCTRNVLNLLQTRMAGRARKAAKSAAKVWVVTREDQRLVKDLWGVEAEEMVETGATPAEKARPVTRRAEEPLRIVWCGILEARKALNLLLDALAELGRPEAWKLDVIGDGPDAAAAREQSRRLRIDANIRWQGKVGHAEARELIAASHLLAHPALKEGTPHVVLEALSAGVPVLCHDACGMGIVVNETCGLKVPLLRPSVTVEGFRAAMARLLDEPDLLGELSKGALRRAVDLSWDSKLKEIARTYKGGRAHV